MYPCGDCEIKLSIIASLTADLDALRAEVKRLKDERDKIVDHWMLQYAGWLDNINYTEAELAEAVEELKDATNGLYEAWECLHVLTDGGNKLTGIYAFRRVQESLDKARVFLARHANK